MFTGIVEGVGKVEKISKNTKNRSAVQMTVNLGKYGKGLKIGTKCGTQWCLPYCNKNLKIKLYF